MDSSGHWHPGSDELMKRYAQTLEEERTGTTLERPVIQIGIGEIVSIVLADDRRVRASFVGAEKNRVTLVPIGACPYLEFASNVRIERANGESVKAQVWDNRNGRIILRTLPV